jgi:hypothetical protein
MSNYSSVCEGLLLVFLKCPLVRVGGNSITISVEDGLDAVCACANLTTIIYLRPKNVIIVHYSSGLSRTYL